MRIQPLRTIYTVSEFWDQKNEVAYHNLRYYKSAGTLAIKWALEWNKRLRMSKMIRKLKIRMTSNNCNDVINGKRFRKWLITSFITKEIFLKAFYNVLLETALPIVEMQKYLSKLSIEHSDNFPKIKKQAWKRLIAFWYSSSNRISDITQVDKVLSILGGKNRLCSLRIHLGLTEGMFPYFYDKISRVKHLADFTKGFELLNSGLFPVELNLIDKDLKITELSLDTLNLFIPQLRTLNLELKVEQGIVGKALSNYFKIANIETLSINYQTSIYQNSPLLATEQRTIIEALISLKHMKNFSMQVSCDDEEFFHSCLESVQYLINLEAFTLRLVSFEGRFHLNQMEESLSKLTQISKFNVEAYQYRNGSEAVLKSCVTGVERLTKLKELRINTRYNKITSASLTTFKKIFSQMTRLKYLDLELKATDLDNELMSDIIRLYEVNESLKYFKLNIEENNKLDGLVLIKLMNAIRKKDDIIKAEILASKLKPEDYSFMFGSPFQGYYPRIHLKLS